MESRGPVETWIVRTWSSVQMGGCPSGGRACPIAVGGVKGGVPLSCFRWSMGPRSRSSDFGGQGRGRAGKWEKVLERKTGRQAGRPGTGALLPVEIDFSVDRALLAHPQVQHLLDK